MDIKELEEIMIVHGAVIRAIPMKIRDVMEVRHAKDYPDGRIEYLEEYKREMLVVERKPAHAGKFLVETAKSITAGVRFSGKRYFDSLEEAAVSLLAEKEE